MSVHVDSAVAVPAVARTRVGHQRTRPFRYGFAHRSTSWLVDVDAPEAAFPAQLRPVLRIRAADHLGSGPGALGDKLRRRLQQDGIGWTAERVLVLVGARTFGHAFDPLTTYFCFDGAGRLEGILAEVHNTYGEGHCYPLEVRGVGAMTTAKEFYVSPFFAVEGRYDIHAHLTAERVTVAIALTQQDDAGEDHRVFHGYVTGALAPATPARVWRSFARDPLASQRVSALIRWHGIRLWLRRLPVVPRTGRHTTTTGRHTTRGLA
jgi:uncharacterized protein